MSVSHRVRPVGIVMLLLAAATLLGLVWAPAARAFTDVAAVGSSLRQTPVYNDPSAERALSDAQEKQVLDAIAAAGTPVYVAVLPKSALTGYASPDALITAIQQATGRPGAYALVVGDSFRAGATEFSAKDIAQRAYDQNRSAGPTAVLLAFIAGVGDRAAGRTSSTSSSSGGGSAWPVLIFFLALLLLAGGAIWWAVRTSRRKKAEALADVRKVVDEDVTEFGEQVMAVDATDPRLDDAGRTDVQAALDAYERARQQTDTMTDASAAQAVTSTLEDGRYALACVQARLDGRPLPERRPPCFFDPRHGPSARDVVWAPPGGTMRDVPACEACAVVVGRGLQPDSRPVPVAGGQQAPYWAAGPQYGGYAGGYYSSFGNVLPALLVGTMLGSMFGGPTHVIDQSASGSDAGWGGGGSGGDFGGGDFGGGGGDFGGGDF